MEFNSIHEMIDEISDQVERFVKSNFARVPADKCGLDIRAGYSLYVNDDAIAVRFTEVRSLEYYGGFEYVERDCVQTLGDFTFYMAEDERVREHIAAYYNNITEEEAQ
jgi:hypothetical protein